MKRSLFLALLLSGTFALPCAAELKDAPAAMTALNSAVPKERLDAIAFLGAQRTQAAYAALAAHFPSEKDAYLRVQLVEALDVQGSTWAYSCAASAADDANKAVRQAAASSLARKAGDKLADTKLQALGADSSEAVSLTVVSALAVNTSTSAAAILGGVLSDGKGALRTRRAAAAALSKMKTPAADGQLLKHAADADPEIKAAAASRKPSKVKPTKKK